MTTITARAEVLKFGENYSLRLQSLDQEKIYFLKTCWEKDKESQAKLQGKIYVTVTIEEGESFKQKIYKLDKEYSEEVPF